MIAGVLRFLRKRLDDHLRAELGGAAEPVADKVVFVDGDKVDPIVFQEGAVTELLVNLEEERQLRSADPYVRVREDGKPQRAQPDLRLLLHVLFVAKFKQYDVAWDHLAKIVEYLQSHRTFEREGSAELPPGLDRLTVDLATQTFAELNDVWGVLRATYHPSVLYRVRLVVVRDAHPVASAQITEPVVVHVKRMP